MDGYDICGVEASVRAAQYMETLLGYYWEKIVKKKNLVKMLRAEKDYFSTEMIDFVLSKIAEKTYSIQNLCDLTWDVNNFARLDFSAKR